MGQINSSDVDRRFEEFDDRVSERSKNRAAVRGGKSSAEESDGGPEKDVYDRSAASPASDDSVQSIGGKWKLDAKEERKAGNLRGSATTSTSQPPLPLPQSDADSATSRHRSQQEKAPPSSLSSSISESEGAETSTEGGGGIGAKPLPQVSIASVLFRPEFGNDGFNDWWEITDRSIVAERWDTRNSGRPVRVSGDISGEWSKEYLCGVCVASAMVRSPGGASRMYHAVLAFDTSKPPSGATSAASGHGCSYAFSNPRAVRCDRVRFVRSVICSRYTNDNGFSVRILSHDRGPLDVIGPSAENLRNDELPLAENRLDVTTADWAAVLSSAQGTRERDALENYRGLAVPRSKRVRQRSGSTECGAAGHRGSSVPVPV